MDSEIAQMHSRNPNDPNARKPDQTLTASWIESHFLFSWISSLEPSLSRPSPSTSSPHPSLLISNPISLTSSIGLQEPHPQSLKASLYGDGSVSTSHSRPPSLLRPSPSTSSLLPSLLISNPNISLTSLIGLQASPSVTHCLPLWRWLRVSLTLTASLHGSASSSSSPSRQTLISETVRLCANTYLISHTVSPTSFSLPICCLKWFFSDLTMWTIA